MRPGIDVAGRLLLEQVDRNERVAALLPWSLQPSAAKRDALVAHAVLFGTRCWAEHWRVEHVVA